MTRTRSRLRGGSCSRRMAMKKADSPARARSVETATGLHPDVGHVCEKKRRRDVKKKSCTILSGPATANLMFIVSFLSSINYGCSHACHMGTALGLHMSYAAGGRWVLSFISLIVLSLLRVSNQCPKQLVNILH